MEKMWLHQVQALNLVKKNLEGGRGALLNCAMGTGKTRVIIEYLREAGHQKILVVAPVAVVPAWRKQVGMFWSLGSCHVHLLNKGKSIIFVPLFSRQLKKTQIVTDRKGIGPEISSGYMTGCCQICPFSKTGHELLKLCGTTHCFLPLSVMEIHQSSKDNGFRLL